MKLIFICCSIIATLLSSIGADPVDPPFNTHTVAGKTVYVSREKKDWFDASDKCEKYDLKFLPAKTTEENSAIQELIKDFDEDVWIGGYRMSKRHTKNPTWLWESDKTNFDWTNWSDGEPQFVDNGGLTDVFCTLMNRNSGKWISKWCGDEAYFLCFK